MLATDNGHRRTSTPIDRTRIGGSRSRSGCQTCRSRRVKCDETRPICIRCSKLGLHCDPTPLEAPARKKQTDRVIIYVGPVKEPSVRLDDTSCLALEYFFARGASDLGSSCSSKLWTGLIPRLATSDDAVRDAAIALSMFHRSFSTRQDCRDLDRPLALKHYGKSLAKLQEDPRDARSSERSLVCCTMFYVIEALQAHFSSAASILTSGIRLLSEYSQSDQNPDKEHLRLLRRTLTLLGTAAMAIEETGSERCIWLATQESLRQPDSSLSAVEAIRDELSLLMNDVLCLDIRVTFAIKTADEQLNMLEELTIIRERYKSFLGNVAALSSTTNEEQHDRATMLILYATRIMFKVALESIGAIPQTIFDQFQAQFDLIVQICEQFILLQTDRNNVQGDATDNLPPTFTMCLGIVPCLYFVCTRCRDPNTRRKALALLKRCNRREGVWDSNVAGVVAETWIKFEEVAARNHWKRVLGCEVTGKLVVPEEVRIDHMSSRFGSEKSAQIQFALTTGELVVEQAMEW